MIKYATLAVALSGCDDDAGNSTIKFTAGPSPLAFAAVQVADEPWHVITPSADGSYTFAADGHTYGIVAVCGDEGYATITVLQATVAETATTGFDCYANLAPRAVLSGTVAGALGQSVVITAAYYGIGMQQPGTWSYSSMVPPGTWDVFAQRYAPTAEIDKVIRRDAVTLAEGAPTVIDFDYATEGFAPESHMVSFEGVAQGEVAEVHSTMRGMPGEATLEMGRSKTGAYQAFPAANLRADDISVITATAALADGSYRQVRRWLLSPADFTAAFPTPPPASLVESESADPYLRMRATLPRGGDIDRYDLVYTQAQSTGPTMIWDARLSKGYVEAANIDSYTLPDVSALEGFKVEWTLMPGPLGLTWQVITTSSNATAQDLLSSDQKASADGARIDTIVSQAGRFPI